MKNPVGRRAFLKKAGTVSLVTAFSPRVFINYASSKSLRSVKIEGAEWYLIHVDAPRHLSHSTWQNRQHAFLRLKASGLSGWSEVMPRVNDLDFNVKKWGVFVSEIIGKSLEEALEYVRSQYGVWDAMKTECLEIALLDIWGQIEGKSVNELFGLENLTKVPGVFTVLEEDPEAAQRQLETARSRNLTQYIKTKLFGDKELDISLVRALRDNLDDDTFLFGDANGAYGYLNLDQTEEVCRRLRDNGLDGSEDLWREMSAEKWIYLQQKVKPLVLIPDYPLRPIWESINTLKPGMGKMYNFHPKVMGSIGYVVKLAQRVKYDWGADVMIGDDSHIGCGATAWQQLACGLGARCVESLEKPEESDLFLQCIEEKVTDMTVDGFVYVKDLKPGWGLKVNTLKLRENSDQFVSV